MTEEQAWLLLGGVWLIAAIVSSPLPKGVPDYFVSLLAGIAAVLFCVAAVQS